MTRVAFGLPALGSIPYAGAALQTGSPTAWLWRLALALLVVLFLTALAALVDDRMLGYYGVWTKPLKFQLALVVQTATLAWGLQQLKPALQRIALPPSLLGVWASVVIFEAGYITLQGARGVASHFNRATVWESAAATLMAGGAGMLVTITLWIGLVSLWQSWRERGSTLALSVGLGFVSGALLAAWSGSAMGAARGYWPQPLMEPVQWMPVTGWVISQTDLRIAHFVGLHQMQVLPAVAVMAAAAGWRHGTVLAWLVATVLASTFSVYLLLQP